MSSELEKIPRRTKRVSRDLASFLDPGAAGDTIRTDGRTWRQVVLEASEALSKPTTKPDEFSKHLNELLRLADIADAIKKEIQEE